MLKLPYSAELPHHSFSDEGQHVLPFDDKPFPSMIA
jgi:hypothetical protein